MTGMLARSALIKSIFERGVGFTGKAKSKITNSDLLNHISTDVSVGSFYDNIGEFVDFELGQPNRRLCPVVCKFHCRLNSSENPKFFPLACR